MQLYNSYTQRLEVFKSIKPNQVSMYVCGPTVYNHAHIGNARPLVVFDTLRRVFEQLNYEVKYVSNYTDVDDRIINQAIEENKSELEISSYYIEQYEAIRNQLNCKPLANVVKVTDTMEQIIAFIDELIKKEKAYQVDKDVYFKIDEIKNYGKLSNQNIEDLVVGSRVVENEKKLNPLDFTLWKKTDKGISWDSSFGKGRPGWHTECVVMIQEEFNHERIDIHGGGMDLKFPHHENEIAQCEALHHHNIANWWIHNGMLNIDGEKMSKSLGNVVWAKDFIAELGGDVVRWLLLSAHYRSPINISQATITQAQQEVYKVKRALSSAQIHLERQAFDGVVDEDQVLLKEFMDAMCDDLNTQNAFRVIFDAIKQLNLHLRQNKNQLDVIARDVITVKMMLEVLGIEYLDVKLSDEDLELFNQWEQAKANKDFELADVYRQKLIEKEYL